MSIALSERVARIKPSPTMALSARAAALRAEGQDIVSLTAGEPDFKTPEVICQAAAQAMNAGMTGYTAVDGTVSLKDSIIAKLERDNQLHYTREQVLVSCGAKHSIFNALLALIRESGEDEVIIPSPYWVSYPDMVLLCGGKPVIVDAGHDTQYKLSADALEKAITPNTRLLILNTPSNPTGMAYTAAELKALGAVLARHPHVLVLTDDIYEHILWRSERFCNLPMVCPELIERTLVINGVSKAYAMTGWRIGYAAGPADWIKAMKKIQSQSTSNPCSIAQAAAEVALKMPLADIQPMIDAFHARHNYFTQALNALPGVTCLPADGAFYAFANVQALLDQKGIADDSALAEQWLKVGVAGVPGSAFGAPGHMRLSFATSQENLEKAIDRLAQATA